MGPHSENPRAEHGMLLDGVVLGRRQRARLAQDVVRNADFADVMEQRAEPDNLDGFRRQTELALIELLRPLTGAG